jgi:hypothetical protein
MIDPKDPPDDEPVALPIPNNDDQEELEEEAA